MAPKHCRLNRYHTLSCHDICALPVEEFLTPNAHLYLWVPNALLMDGMRVMEAWRFDYKNNFIWHKIRKDGGSDGRGVSFYFRNVTEIILFGVRGKNARTLAPGRRQVNLFATRKREHSRKPDEQYDIIESCSSGPFLELFTRGGVMAGMVGAIKPMMSMNLIGKLTSIILQQLKPLSNLDNDDRCRHP